MIWYSPSGVKVAASGTSTTRNILTLVIRTISFGTLLVVVESDRRMTGHRELWRKRPTIDLGRRISKLWLNVDSIQPYQVTAEIVTVEDFSLSSPRRITGKAKAMTNCTTANLC
jgi:hypothetical protein